MSRFDPDLGPLTDASKWAIVRCERNQLLVLSDWSQLADAPLSTAQRAAWAAYRQALRDITETYGDPEAVEFPARPG